MSRNPRADLIRKVEARMKRRNRVANILTLFIGLALGLVCGIWLIWMDVIPVVNLRGEKPVDDPSVTLSEPTPFAEGDEDDGDFIPDEPTDEPADEPTKEPTDEPTNEPTEEPTDSDTYTAPDDAPDVDAEAKLRSLFQAKNVADEPTVAPIAEPTVAPTPVVTQEPVVTPEPTITPAPTVFKTYKMNDWNEEVKKIQEALVAEGYLKNKADGIFGKNTETAIKAYQEANGLEVTGKADDPTQQVLFGLVQASTEEEIELVQPLNPPDPAVTYSLSMGAIQEIPGMCELSIDRFDFASTVEPSNISEDSPSTYFESSNNDVIYLYLTGKITNTSDKAIVPNAIKFSIDTGKMVDTDGFAAFETPDGRNLMVTGVLEAGMSTKMVALVEVPVELRDSQDPIVASITVGNVVCKVTLR